MKKILLFFIVLSISKFSYSQNFQKSFSISTNVFQDILNEYAIWVDYYYAEKRALGLCLGLVHYNEQFDPAPLSPSQDRYPGTVYEGYVSRLTYSYNFARRNTIYSLFKGYLSPQLTYKYIYYNDHEFLDTEKGKTSHRYIRDEKTNQLGGAVIIGCIIASKRSKLPIHLILNPFFGLGYTHRWRDMVTDDFNPWSNPSKNSRSEGNFAILLGFKIGLHFIKYDSKTTNPGIN